MGIAEQYEAQVHWQQLLFAVGFETDGRPAKVYELATLVMADKELERLVLAHKATKPLPLSALSDNPPEREPLCTDYFDVLACMAPYLKELLRQRVVTLYQQKQQTEVK
jgi:hypothetical protein